MPSRHLTFAIVLLTASTLLGARGTEAQTQPGFFSPGGRTLFDLDLASTPVGSVPAALTFDQADKSRPGRPTVVIKDGKRVLKATEPSEFVVTLNENLPEVFTLEFDIIPKTCCNPEDLSFEGTRKISRSSASAHVVWHPTTIIVAGGGEYFQTPIPPDISETLPSTPTTVAASFNGGTLALFTNGRLLFTLNNRKFIRGRVLRVFLGAQEGEAYAVYMSRLRIADAVWPGLFALSLRTSPGAGRFSHSIPDDRNSGPSIFVDASGRELCPVLRLDVSDHQYATTARVRRHGKPAAAITVRLGLATPRPTKPDLTTADTCSWARPRHGNTETERVRYGCAV